MKGIIIKSTGSWYSVLDQAGKQYDCRLRGKFKMEGLRSTNPIAVGDHVEFILQGDDGIITGILSRKNYIIRKSTNLSHKTQIIAANIDQALLIATLHEPRTSTGFIDRFLVTAEAYSIPAQIIFNKTDIYDVAEMKLLDELIAIYEPLGYPCHKVSAQEKTNLEVIKQLLRDKVSLVSGHSGVGKSTLINAIEPGLQLKTGEISQVHLKGKHTTTFAEMFKLSDNGFIIDTPGIKEFGLVDFEPWELCHYFPEMRQLFNQCKFDNCTHMHEPGCEVKKNLEAGNISISRYSNYLNMLTGEDNRG